MSVGATTFQLSTKMWPSWLEIESSWQTAERLSMQGKLGQLSITNIIVMSKAQCKVTAYIPKFLKPSKLRDFKI